MIKQLSLFDDNGTLIKSSTYKGSKLKEDWCVVYKEGLNKLIDTVPNFTTLKVFLKLTALQTYDPIVVVTIKYLSETLNISYKATWEAIKWLEKSGMVKRTFHNGAKGFLLDLDITTCGRTSIEQKEMLWHAHRVKDTMKESKDESLKQALYHVSDEQLSSGSEEEEYVIEYVPPEEFGRADIEEEDDVEG